MFSTGDIGIRWYDAETHLIHYLYEYEHGERLHVPAAPPDARRHLGTDGRETRQPIVVEQPSRCRCGRDRRRARHRPEPVHRCRFPILGSDRVLGTIALENYERENAFGEADVRLLTTVAASMGVALENARLFDETQRLLKETEQRAAELAVINSVQEGMAAELDFQAIIDLVGDKLREVFDTGDIGIRWYDAADRPHPLPVSVRARRAA